MRRFCQLTALLGLVSLCLALVPARLAHADERPTISVLRLDAASASEQEHADEVSAALFELLAGSERLYAIDRRDVTMGDLALIYGCEVDNVECMRQVADDFATVQLLYGKVESFGEDVTVKLSLYDAASEVVRPVYSRRIPRAELQKLLRSDIADLLFGALWELPGYLNLTLATSASGAEVSIDGRTYGTAPLARARVDAGERTVEVLASGYEPWREKVRFDSGATVTLSVTLARPGEGRPVVLHQAPEPDTGRVDPVRPPPQELPPPGETIYRAPASAWIALGLGGASLIAASVTGGLALEAEDDYQNELRERQSAEIRDRGEALSLATNVLLGVGLSGLAVSAVLFVTLGEWQPVDGTDLALSAAPRSDGGASIELRIGF